MANSYKHTNKEITMALSMYVSSVPVLKLMLQNLAAILKKASDHADSRKIDPSVFVNARLAPDMLPLSKQIQIATDQAKGCAARLAGVDIPKFDDTEKTFDELQARIAKTVAFLDGFAADQFDGS